MDEENDNDRVKDLGSPVNFFDTKTGPLPVDKDFRPGVLKSNIDNISSKTDISDPHVLPKYRQKLIDERNELINKKKSTPAERPQSIFNPLGQRTLKGSETAEE